MDNKDFDMDYCRDTFNENIKFMDDNTALSIQNRSMRKYVSLMHESNLIQNISTVVLILTGFFSIVFVDGHVWGTVYGSILGGATGCAISGMIVRFCAYRTYFVGLDNIKANKQNRKIAGDMKEYYAVEIIGTNENYPLYFRSDLYPSKSEAIDAFCDVKTKTVFQAIAEMQDDVPLIFNNDYDAADDFEHAYHEGIQEIVNTVNQMQCSLRNNGFWQHCEFTVKPFTIHG